MEKYYVDKYDRRVGGSYSEILNEEFKFVRIHRGSTPPEGLEHIAHKSDIVSSLYETEPLGKGYVRLVSRIEGAAITAAETFRRS